MNQEIVVSANMEKCLKKMLIAVEKAKGNDPKGEYRLTDGKYHINVKI